MPLSVLQQPTLDPWTRPSLIMKHAEIGDALDDICGIYEAVCNALNISESNSWWCWNIRLCWGGILRGRNLRLPVRVIMVCESWEYTIIIQWTLNRISKSLCLCWFCTALYRRDQAVATYFLVMGKTVFYWCILSFLSASVSCVYSTARSHGYHGILWYMQPTRRHWSGNHYILIVQWAGLRISSNIPYPLHPWDLSPFDFKALVSPSAVHSHQVPFWGGYNDHCCNTPYRIRWIGRMIFGGIPCMS